MAMNGILNRIEFDSCRGAEWAYAILRADLAALHENPIL